MDPAVMDTAPDCDDADLLKRESNEVAHPTSSGSALKSKGRNQPPLVCQVPGCEASLLCLREYYQRYKICEYHRQLDQMVGCNGELQRFCQQCGRFQPLTAFDDNKRSCRERLAKHNERRRRRTASDLSTYGKPSGQSASSGVDHTLMLHNSSLWGQASPTFAQQQDMAHALAQQQHSPRDAFHLKLQMMQLQELDQKLLLSTHAAAAAAAAATPMQHALYPSSLSPMDTYMMQPRPLYPTSADSIQPAPWDRPSSNSRLSSMQPGSERSSHTLSKLPYLAPGEPPELLQALRSSSGDAMLQPPPAFPQNPYGAAAANRAAFARGVAVAAASMEEERGGSRRANRSWPLAQLQLSMQGHKQPHSAQEVGLIKGEAIGCDGSSDASDMMYQPYPYEAAMAGLRPGVTQGHHLSHLSQGCVGMPAGGQCPPQRSDVRVLGENQTLAALWEHITVNDV